MEDKILERRSDEVSSYRILRFPFICLSEEYHSIIFAKWLNSLRTGNSYFRLIKSDAYYKAYKPYIESILSRPQTIISLAVLPDDQSNVLGFSIVEGDILHYVYVQQVNRGNGIGKTLVPRNIARFTHLTNSWIKIWNNHLKHLTFNPFL